MAWRTEYLNLLALSSVILLYCLHFNGHTTGTPCPRAVLRYPSRDLLLGFAVNYNAGQLYRTIHAFHEYTGPGQHIALFVSLGNETVASLVERFPRALLLRPDQVLDAHDEFMGVSPSNITHTAFQRYIYIGKWLAEHRKHYDKVIMTDARDIAIYGDPFEQIDLNDGIDIQTFTEPNTYRNCPVYNQPWIRACYGDNFLQTIMNETITCCGLIAGTSDGLVKYMHAFLAQLKDKYTCHPIGADTAIHVWIIHKILDGAQMTDSEHSLLRNWLREETVAERFDLTTGGVTNLDGRPYALIHQFDRHATLVNAYNKRHDINHETDQFRHAVGMTS